MYVAPVKQKARCGMVGHCSVPEDQHSLEQNHILLPPVIRRTISSLSLINQQNISAILGIFLCDPKLASTQSFISAAA